MWHMYNKRYYRTTYVPFKQASKQDLRPERGFALITELNAVTMIQKISTTLTHSLHEVVLQMQTLACDYNPPTYTLLGRDSTLKLLSS